MVPAISLALNILRLTTTVLFHGYAGPEAAEALHDLSGWAALALAVVFLLGAVRFLRWMELPVDPPADRARGMSGGGGFPAQRWGPPVGALGVLLSMMFVGGIDARPPTNIEGYHSAVRASINGLPYVINGAIGVDEDAAPGIDRMLRTNAMIQRRYTDPATGDSFALAIVHCRDARNLVDHYPPVCYPASGWRAVGSERHLLPGSPSPTPVGVYDFERDRGWQHARTSVVSFFILPDESAAVVDSMDAVTAASRSPSRTGLGAAHVMLSFSGDTNEDQMIGAAATVLELLQPTIRIIAHGSRG
jgi:hypothetical protein